jgi:hypothetical protein
MRNGMRTKGIVKAEANTRPEIDVRIARKIEESIAYYSTATAAEIRRRLLELEDEWDIERSLETGAAAAMLTSLAFGRLIHRSFYALAGVVGGLLLQHALQGWGPTLSVLRERGVRTTREIERERAALLRLLDAAENPGRQRGSF